MSTSADEQRLCLELDCDNPIHGRVDKKFCSDQCRNLHNNRTAGDSTKYMRTVTAILKKNRRILADLNPEGKKKISKEDLLRKGFNFEYFTNILITKKEKKEYRYCYDQGYFEMSSGWYLLVHRLEYD